MLISRGENPPSELHGTWTATVKGHDQSYSGELMVEVDPEVFDVTEWITEQLAPAESE